MCVGFEDSRLVDWSVGCVHRTAHSGMGVRIPIRVDRDKERLREPHTYTPIVNEE